MPSVVRAPAPFFSDIVKNTLSQSALAPLPPLRARASCQFGIFASPSSLSPPPPKVSATTRGVQDVISNLRTLFQCNPGAQPWTSCNGTRTHPHHSNTLLKP
jgi:hypothetical protein